MSNFIELKDLKLTPDVIQKYPPPKGSSIIIDNGSYESRVGWSSSEEPLFCFRNLIAKSRKERERVILPTQIGNDIVNIEGIRHQLRTQFDKNVVTHFQAQEQIFDYIFTHLGVNTDSCVPHSIVMSECFANPNHNRQLMTELLFECYDVPSICYAIDSLCSYKRNNIPKDSLIVSFGYHSVHVIPVLNNKVIYTKVRRLNLGGFNMINYINRLMQLKYPVHLTAITLGKMEDLLKNHCSVSEDYMGDLKLWANMDFYEQNIKKVQLPFTVQQPTLTAEQKLEKRRELSKKLVEITTRKRHEKLREDEEQYEIMVNIWNLLEEGDLVSFNQALKENNLESKEELHKLMTSVKTRADRSRIKLSQPPQPLDEKVTTPSVPVIPSGFTAIEWVEEVKRKRSEIHEKKQNRYKRRQDLAKRRTAAAQERMRIISQLAKKEKGTDDFGMRDEDWDVYKVISRENDSDSEAENEKLIEYEDILRHYDPNYEDPTIANGIGTAEYHQLHVGLEAIKTPELLFQPSMMGSSEAGIAELIEFVLKMFTPEEQLRLANGVFLTGGCAKFPGLEKRISIELLKMRPFQTPHKVFVAENPSLDAWFGLRDLGRRSNLKDISLTKKDYLENGAEYFKIHDLSNLYFKTPVVVDQDIKNEN